MDTHPLAVKGTKSEDRWAQTKHEIWQPLPCKQITVSVSGSGKSSVILAAVSALFDHFDFLLSILTLTRWTLPTVSSRTGSEKSTCAQALTLSSTPVF